MGIRWSLGFRSGGVEVEDSSLSKGIVMFLGLVVGSRAMSMDGSCVSLRAVLLTGPVWLLLPVVRGGGGVAYCRPGLGGALRAVFYR